MRIVYIKKAKKQWTTNMEWLLRSAVTFSILHYKLNHSNAKLSVKMMDLSDKGHRGQAIHLKPNHCMIHIDAMPSWEQLVETVFHEMCHVKQYLTQGLAFDTELSASFRGKVFSFKNYDYHAYINTPWEREAVRAEKTLYKLWEKSHEVHDIT